METHDNRSPFLESVRAAIRVRKYSYATEKAYLDWIKRFILFHKKRHPAEMGEREVGAYLSYLAVDRDVSASTQNQALNALVFMYTHVLERPLEQIHGVVRAKRGARLPVVLSDVRTTQLYTHVINRGGMAVQSPLGATLRLNPKAVPGQTDSRDTDTSKQKPPYDD